jgi:hypothetical protein
MLYIPSALPPAANSCLRIFPACLHKSIITFMQYLLHPAIPATFLEYLTAAGYKFTKETHLKGTFTRDKVTLVINQLQIRVHRKAGRMVIKDFPDAIERPMFFSGIEYLDFTGWVLLMSCFGVVSLAEFIGSVSEKELSQMLSVLSSRRLQAGPGYECPTLDLQEETNY